MSDFGNQTSPVGRKDYRCEWCGQTIAKGERHVHYVGVWREEWQNWRMHYECYDGMDRYDLEDGFMPYEGERPTVQAKGGTQ